MPDNILYDVTVDDGKYRFVYFSDGKPPMAYRHGEAWDPRIASMVGDKALFSLVAELSEARDMLATATHNLSVSAGPSAEEIISKTSATGILTVRAEVEVPMERIVNCIVGALEGGYSPWLHSFIHADLPSDPPLRDSFDETDPVIWYAREKFWTLGGKASLVYDTPTDDEGAGTGQATVGLIALRNGLNIMASKAPRHFADLVAENDDAVTHDVFMQMVVLGDIVYS